MTGAIATAVDLYIFFAFDLEVCLTAPNSSPCANVTYYPQAYSMRESVLARSMRAIQAGKDQGILSESGLGASSRLFARFVELLCNSVGGRVCTSERLSSRPVLQNTVSYALGAASR
jgi:hypothetical protein